MVLPLCARTISELAIPAPLLFFPGQILRYTRGQKYEAHHDYFNDPVNKQQGGHRYATVLMYLNDVQKGGETAFPEVKDPTPKDDTWSDCAKGVLAGEGRVPL